MNKNSPHSADSRLQDLITLLSDGGFHSGDELGELLGVSRAAVWKQIQKLQGLGLDVQSIRGKGYRLVYPMEWLDSDIIAAAVNAEVRGLLAELDVRMLVNSTNDIAMQRAAGGVGSGYVCLAEQQAAGRGRRGRSWVSPFASNLYLSLVWEFSQGAAQLEGLSLAAGVAVVKGLKRLGLSGAGLKWPNDVLVQGAKISGILLEMTGDPSGRCQVVVGVGVNHRLPVNIGEQIDQTWVRLEDLRPGISRNELASVILIELLTVMEVFSRQGFSAYRDDWMKLDVYAGQSVVIKAGVSDIHGVARGVDQSGGLLLEVGGHLEVIKGGELSLRSLL